MYWGQAEWVEQIHVMGQIECKEKVWEERTEDGISMGLCGNLM